MEASLKKFKELFELEDTDIRSYSPLTLAYIGDAIYELVIRTILVEKGNTQVNKLHQILQKKKWEFSKEEEMQNPLPWQKMPVCPITEELRDLRR